MRYGAAELLHYVTDKHFKFWSKLLVYLMKCFTILSKVTEPPDLVFAATLPNAHEYITAAFAAGFAREPYRRAALGGKTPAEAYRAGRPVAMMDKARALPASPQAQQQQQEDNVITILAA